MTDRLSVDLETRSACDLRTAGVYRYAEDPTTDVLCLAWALNDAEPAIWMPGMPVPEPLRVHIAAGKEMRAWNAQFESTLWPVLVSHHGFPAVEPTTWADTMIESYAAGCPGSLGQAALVLGVPQQKDDAGHRLMLRLSKPRALAEDGTPLWWDDDAMLAQLAAYCQQDVRTEQAVYRALPRWTDALRDAWHLDQRMNRRGVRVDMQLLAGAQQVVREDQQRAAAQLAMLTDQQVTSVMQHGKLLAWVQARYPEAGTSLGRPEVRRLLARPDTPPEVRAVLNIRQQSGRTSPAKLQAVAASVCRDERVRGMFQFHGAHTGRWAGRLVQLQNLPRGEFAMTPGVLDALRAARYPDLDTIAPPSVLVASSLRSLFVAPAGRRLVAGDFSAIECRVLNWLAGETVRSQQLAAGQDVYVLNAAQLYGVAPEAVSKTQRQTGKFQELACGYGMGAAKAVASARDVYGLDLSDDMATRVVNAYREGHPRVVQYWYDLERACIQAVQTPGFVGTAGDPAHPVRVWYQQEAWLVLQLPSGRQMWYRAPVLRPRATPWGAIRLTLHYSGSIAGSRQWGLVPVYGGLLVENVVQAVSADILMAAMARLEQAGYPPVMCIHDEIVVEAPDHGASHTIPVQYLMQEQPDWLTCPVPVEVWEGPRYRK